MANARTVARLEARIRERAAHCIEFELADPRAAFITVTGVKLSSDLYHAKISYSVLGSESERSRAKHMLESATGFIQRQVGRVLRTRRVPRIAWEYDDTVEFQAEMEKQIQDALDRDREINPEAHGENAQVDSEVEAEYEEFLSEQDEDETS